MLNAINVNKILPHKQRKKKKLERKGKKLKSDKNKTQKVEIRVFDKTEENKNFENS